VKKEVGTPEKPQNCPRFCILKAGSQRANGFLGQKQGDHFELIALQLNAKQGSSTHQPWRWVQATKIATFHRWSAE
jgi:hypothetical protein